MDNDTRLSRAREAGYQLAALLESMDLTTNDREVLQFAMRDLQIAGEPPCIVCDDPNAPRFKIGDWIAFGADDERPVRITDCRYSGGRWEYKSPPSWAGLWFVPSDGWIKVRNLPDVGSRVRVGLTSKYERDAIVTEGESAAGCAMAGRHQLNPEDEGKTWRRL
jgi:hypothetical protein